MKLREKEDQDMRTELEALLKTNTDLLIGAISRLDEMKKQTQ